MTKKKEKKKEKKIVPTGDNLLVERDKVEEALSPAGLVLPKQNIKQPDTATVLAVGPDASDFVSIGDTVILSRFAGTDVIVGIDTHTIVCWRDVLAVFN